MTPASKVLATNQGLYDDFLAAGLVRGLSLGASGRSVQRFFPWCVIIASVYGGMTASRRILLVQAQTAALA
jgi:putative membrane protein